MDIERCVQNSLETEAIPSTRIQSKKTSLELSFAIIPGLKRANARRRVYKTQLLSHLRFNATDRALNWPATPERMPAGSCSFLSQPVYLHKLEAIIKR